jgi:hypothetical protein
MNWITWAIGAGNAALLEMFQHKIATMHQDLTNQNTNLLSRINFLEQANANQSRQLLNLQKKMETADEAATQMVADLYKKATSNQQTPLKTITTNKDKKSDKEGKVGKPASYAAVAKSNTSQNTNVTSKNENQKQLEEPKPTFKALYPRVERQIIIKHNTIITGDLYLASVKALKLVNNAMTNHQDITSPPFIMASFRRDSTSVLTTAPTHRNVDYNNYLAIVKDALKDLKPEEATLTSRMTKFLVHGIPTFYTPDEVRKDIEIANPSVKLTETPRWLTSDEKRQGKQASTMVIAICGTATLKDLGESVIVASKRCTVETYLTFGPSTQCNFCQRYGHPSQRCPFEKDKHLPTCAVCAGPHLTELHTCTLDTCRQGILCTHPPIKCVNCDAPHKATDPECPTRTKIQLDLKAKWQTSEPPQGLGGSA